MKNTDLDAMEVGGATCMEEDGFVTLTTNSFTLVRLDPA